MERSSSSEIPIPSNETSILINQNPNPNPMNTSWPTIDGALGLSEQDSLPHARKFFTFGFFLLPLLWAVNCYYFWPVLRRSTSFPRIRPYVVGSAIGFTVFSAILLSWALTFTIGGERLFGHTWDELLSEQVFEPWRGIQFVKTAHPYSLTDSPRFPCGGVAVAVCISHKVGDAFTMVNFVKHWATVTRGESPIYPTFIFPKSRNTLLPEFSVNSGAGGTSSKARYAQRRFVFPNSKLSELKNKINLTGTTPINPTRVESLASLISKCAVDAATTTSGIPQPSILNLLVNMRKNISTLCHKSTAGNITTVATAEIAESSQLHLNKVITSLRKARMELQGIKDVEKLGESLLKKLPSLVNKQSNLTCYICTSVCRFPFYQVDFGWGNPVWVTILIRNVDRSQFIFMDSASGDGIEAIVKLKEEVMDVLQIDKELLAYVQDMS